MPKFREKLQVVDAIQFTGDNAGEVLAWATEHKWELRLLGSVLALRTTQGAFLIHPSEWLIVSPLRIAQSQAFAKLYEAVDG